MDPATLALTAAGLVAKQALEAAGGKAGEGAWAVLGRIREAIWSKFRGDQEVTETLERLEAKPESQARSAELAEVLQPRLKADPQLVAELTRLVEEAKADPQTAAFVTTVQDNARVGKLTNIGQIVGDVHL
jgi:surfactin synthase thioesterase subunit